MKNALSSYLYLQLNELITFLVDVPLWVDPKLIGYEGHHFIKNARTNLEKINLVTFRVFDLLRCKCTSGEEEIIYLVEDFERKDKKCEGFELVRVKDRLSQGTRDVMINGKFGNGPVCEIQLAICSSADIKQDLLDKYNHFLYELKRSKNLGPLIENISIWTSIEQRSLYFDELTERKFDEGKSKKF